MKYLLTFEGYSQGAMVEDEYALINKRRNKAKREELEREAELEKDDDYVDLKSIDPSKCITPEAPSEEEPLEIKDWRKQSKEMSTPNTGVN
ncbi:hypothetical protein [Sporocytophaga myxococcoides]|uniref:hypothetical protein n=1 Tax=Sporocytophaga myxococcoides TaxID=153721 RepID=UPI000421CEC7|nr:hypothetical protein [Sporocytophaga myxococcoides]